MSRITRCALVLSFSQRARATTKATRHAEKSGRIRERTCMYVRMYAGSRRVMNSPAKFCHLHFSRFNFCTCARAPHVSARRSSEEFRRSKEKCSCSVFSFFSSFPFFLFVVFFFFFYTKSTVVSVRVQNNQELQRAIHILTIVRVIKIFYLSKKKKTERKKLNYRLTETKPTYFFLSLFLHRLSQRVH